MSEIGPGMGIAGEGCEFRGEGACDGRWIDQPLKLERFQPAEAVADDHTAPGRSGAVSAAAMEGRAEEQHGVSGPDLRHDRERLGQIAGILVVVAARPQPRSEEHTSELQSLMRISYAVFCLKNKK